MNQYIYHVFLLAATIAPQDKVIQLLNESYDYDS